MVQEVDCIVIGAGVVGIAVARALAQAKREVVLLEAADAVGTGISGRNSEVIHAGLYYPKNSQKALLCVRGRRLLYQFCQDAHVPHKETGKLIVSTAPEEVPMLHDLHARGITNGIRNLQFLSGAEARRLEPALKCVGALYVPITGIVDAKALMTAMVAQAESAGAKLMLKTPVRSVRAMGLQFEIDCGVGKDATKIRSRALVNAAGLNAQAVAAGINRMQAALIPPLHMNKGVYFSISGQAPFQHLVYPVPRPEGLGIHFTMDMAGNGRFGPDNEWVDSADFRVDPARAQAFYDAVRQYYPDLKQGALQPAFAGIRPKIQGPGQPQADFVLQGRAQHGISGLVNLFGIDSPGLTAALAIATEVVALVKQ